MVSAGLGKPGSPGSPSGPSAQLIALNSASREQVLQILKPVLSNWAKNPKHATASLRELALASLPEVAVQVLQCMGQTGLEVNSFHVGAVVLACEKAKQWRLALDLSQETTLDTVVRNAAISSCSKGGHWWQALELLWKSCKDRIEADVITFSSVLKGIDWQQAVGLLERVRGHAVFPNSFTCSSAIHCIKWRSWSMAAELISRMQHLHVEANGVVRSALVGATATHSSWESATFGLLTMRIYQISVNDICQNAAITSCASAAEWRGSVHCFSDMRHFSTPTVVSFTALISSFSDFTWRWPVFLFSQLRFSGFEMDPFCSSAAAKVSVDSLDWQLSLKLFAESTPRNEISYNAATEACKHGKWEHALSLISEMLQLGIEPSAITFANVLNACRSSGQWRCSLHLLMEMKLLRIRSTVVSCSAAMNACSESGRWEWALHLFVAESEAEFDAIACSAIISACERGGQWRLACELFASAQEMTLEVDTVMCNGILSALHKGSQWQNALANVRHMQTCALQVDDITRNSAISACEVAQRWEMAIAIAEKVTYHRLQQDEVTYNAVISCLDNRWALALQSAGQMTLCSLLPSFITVDSVACALQKSSEWKFAILQLERTSTLTCADVLAYNAAVMACEASFQWKAVLELLMEMSRVACVACASVRSHRLSAPRGKSAQIST